MKAEQLLNITLRMKGLQLDQLRSLINGSHDPDDYNPNALAQIETILFELRRCGLLDEDDFKDLTWLSQQMRVVIG